MSFPNQYIANGYAKTPCKYCTTETGRSPGCHVKCEKYLAYRTAMDEKGAKIRKTKDELYKPASLRNIKRVRMKGAKHGEV